MKLFSRSIALVLSVLMLLSGMAFAEGEQYAVTLDQLYFQLPGTEEPVTLPYAFTLSLAQEDDKIFSGDLSLTSGEQELLGVKVGYEDGSILAWANSGDTELSHVLEIPVADAVAYLQSMTGADASEGAPIDFSVPANLFKSYFELLKAASDPDQDQEKLYEDVFEQLAASGAIVLEMTDQPALEGSDDAASSSMHIEFNDLAAFMDALCAQDNTMAEFWNNYLDYIALLSEGEPAEDTFESILASMRMTMDVTTQEDGRGWSTADADVNVQLMEEEESIAQVRVNVNAREYCNPEDPDDTKLELSLSCGADDLSLLAMSINAQQNTTDGVADGSFSLAFSTNMIDAFAYDPESLSETETIDDPESSKSADESERIDYNAPAPDVDPLIVPSEEIGGSFSVDYTLVNDAEIIAQLAVTLESGEEGAFKAGLNVHADREPIDAVPVMGFESANKLNPFTASESELAALLQSVESIGLQMIASAGLSFN